MDLDYSEIFERLGPGLYRLAFSYVKNRSDAEDAVQETFLRLLKTNRRFDTQEDCKRWLMTVTANQCKDLLRSARRRREVTMDNDELSRLSAAETDAAPDIGTALFRLPEKYRSVIYLHYYEGYPTKEISKILHVTQSAVLSRLERARNQLRQLLGGEWNDG